MKKIICLFILNFILIDASDTVAEESYASATWRIYELNEDASQINQIDDPCFLNRHDVHIKNVILDNSINKTEQFRNVLIKTPRKESFTKEKFYSLFNASTIYDILLQLLNSVPEPLVVIVVNKKYLFHNTDNKKLSNLQRILETSQGPLLWEAWVYNQDEQDIPQELKDNKNDLHIDMFFLNPVFEKTCEEFIEDSQKEAQSWFNALENIIKNGGRLDPALKLDFFDTKNQTNYLFYCFLAAIGVMGVTGLALWKTGRLQIKFNTNPQN